MHPSFCRPILNILLMGSLALFALKVAGAPIHVPLGGNSWVRGGNTEKITSAGLVNWSSPDATIDTYLRFSVPGTVKLYLRADVKGTSKVNITIGGKSIQFVMQEGTTGDFYAGEWTLPAPGYVKIQMQGLSKTAPTFATPTEWILEGNAVDGTSAFVKNNEDNYYYWGRRGPSVHLNYTTPTTENIEWFYNEVTVPEGQDVIGSYFMANGFAEGYFGIQVNSDTERRVLFSVWSPYKTDDPKSIPKDQQIRMLRKGEGVYTGEFGNEGAGGQSYLRYNWQAGRTYRFLLQGKPSGDSATTYSAYFFAPEVGSWQLIASFERPHTQTYLKRLHSFLENFVPTTGDTSRRVNFGNQWVRDEAGTWTELTKARFTADATARKGYRMDYAGGQEGGRFYLQNCGFFPEFTIIGTEFERIPIRKPPVVAIEALP